MKHWTANEKKSVEKKEPAMAGYKFLGPIFRPIESAPMQIFRRKSLQRIAKYLLAYSAVLANAQKVFTHTRSYHTISIIDSFAAQK